MSHPPLAFVEIISDDASRLQCFYVDAVRGGIGPSTAPRRHGRQVLREDAAQDDTISPTQEL
jgi:hypothetical protein